MNKEQRILAVICIASAFLIVELAIGFRNRSLALIADAFHITSDLIGYVVAYVAVIMSRRERVSPKKYSFGYQKASLVAGFFNGCEYISSGRVMIAEIMLSLPHGPWRLDHTPDY
jgi:zinc transporter 1